MKKKKENDTSVIDTSVTVGKLARDLLLKNDVLPTPNEQKDEQLKEYEKNVEICVKDSKKKFIGDFYVVVLTKKERLLQNVIRNYFYGRVSCPTPDYDQIVYKYDKKSDSLDFLWVIPDRNTCHYLGTYSHKVDPSQWELLSFIFQFADGSLFKLAKKLNGEKDKTPELEKGH